MLKRVGLFVLTNIAVLLVITVSARLLGVDQVLSQNGLNLGSLLVFSLIAGFAGSIISLLSSKQMAKISVGARVITTPSNREEHWLLDSVAKLSKKAGIAMPEVAIFEDASPNAFATGAFKNSALVAVSRGLLRSMSSDEVEAVLAHEIGHIANGDMVTLTLIQGVVNTFVIFFSRVVGYLVDRVVLKNRDDRSGAGYMIASLVAQVIFGFLASLVVMAFSRHREYRADEAGAALSTPRAMISALQALKRASNGSSLPKEVQAFGINGNSLRALFSTHPPLDDRIEKLKAYL